MNKMQLLDKCSEFAHGEIGQANLSDKQYNEIVALANRIEELPNTDVSKIPQIRMLISLFQKLDKQAVINPRDVKKVQENNALSAYNSHMSKCLAIWKMGLNTPPTETEVLAKTALLDKEYRANIAHKMELARIRNEFIQSN